MTHGSLFSGIGGFDLAAEWMGWENVFHCEWNEYCQKILNKHWPNAKSYADITKTNFGEWEGRIDILTGGFPCQPFSAAGDQKGEKDERYLWPEMFRAFKEIGPMWGVGENVPGIIDSEFSMQSIENDLTSIGYSLLPVKISASIVGANHKRERVWFIAYADSNGMERRRNGRDFKENRQGGADCKKALFNQKKFTEGYSDKSESELIRADDGIPYWMERVNAIGNSVSPQVALKIFKTIEQYDELHNNIKRAVH